VRASPAVAIATSLEGGREQQPSLAPQAIEPVDFEQEYRITSKREAPINVFFMFTEFLQK